MHTSCTTVHSYRRLFAKGLSKIRPPCESQTKTSYYVMVTRQHSEGQVNPFIACTNYIFHDKIQRLL